MLSINFKKIRLGKTTTTGNSVLCKYPSHLFILLIYILVAIKFSLSPFYSAMFISLL